MYVRDENGVIRYVAKGAQAPAAAKAEKPKKKSKGKK